MKKYTDTQTARGVALRELFDYHNQVIPIGEISTREHERLMADIEFLSQALGIRDMFDRWVSGVTHKEKNNES